jgi:hypothetical protein
VLAREPSAKTCSVFGFERVKHFNHIEFLCKLCFRGYHARIIRYVAGQVKYFLLEIFPKKNLDLSDFRVYNRRMQKPRPNASKPATVGPKICIIDIETSPNVVHTWGLFKQNIAPNQVQDYTRVISFAAKWLGDKSVEFYSEFHDGHREMIAEAHRILSEADVVVHYNGSEFDIPHLKREFLMYKMPPPAPFSEVDLIKVVKRHFRFMSNRLQHVCEQTGIGSKVKHGGQELWTGCLNGDARSWVKMREYNKHDTVLTEQLYKTLLPWIDNHPHVGLLTRSTEDSCNRCNSTKLEYRGFAYTKNGSYQRFRCTKCNGWGRCSKRFSKVNNSGIK